MTTATESCPLCNGTGWQIRQSDNEREVVRCQCRVLARPDALLRRAQIPDRYQDCEFSNFSADPSPSVAEALRFSKSFVEKYPVEHAGLLLVGSVGVGKTHLAVAIIKELMRQKGANCLFYDYGHLLKTIQDSFNSSSQITEMNVLRPVMETEVLLFDELGAVRPTDWVQETVSHILNIRYNESRTTIITTNYPDLPPLLSQIEAGENLTSTQRTMRKDTLGDRIGERMWSRLHEMCRKIEISGPDYRKEYNSLRPTRQRMAVKRRSSSPDDTDA
jgi:DNA replication protein DnaC